MLALRREERLELAHLVGRHQLPLGARVPRLPAALATLGPRPCRSARWSGESLEGSLLELPEFWSSRSFSSSTNCVSSSTFCSSSAMRWSRGSVTGPVDHEDNVNTSAPDDRS